MGLTSEESRLVFDCFFRCAEREQIDRGSAVIASNPKAAKLYAGIGRAVARLKHINDENCPDELVFLTIARLKLAAAMKSLSHKTMVLCGPVKAIEKN